MMFDLTVIEFWARIVSASFYWLSSLWFGYALHTWLGS